jgi:PKHD-type hydroxylase
MFYTKDNILTQEEIQQIFDSKEYKFTQSSLLSDGVDANIRNSLDTFLQDEFQWLSLKIAKHIHIINKEHYKFQLIACESLQLTHYKEGMFYKAHLDIEPFTEDTQRKLTFVIQLSNENDYDGGDLIIHTSSIPSYAPRQQGSITVFPSFLLHEVTPITRGERYSLVGWCYGIRLR